MKDDIKPGHKRYSRKSLTGFIWLNKETSCWLPWTQ